MSRAVPSGSQQFVGGTYDPLTDKFQSEANAPLDFSDQKVTGRLNVAGVDIPLGDGSNVVEQNDHSRVETYAFTKESKECSVEENGEQIGLRGRIDKSGQKLTGTITRPSSRYGSIAFSFLPEKGGFPAEDVANSVDPQGKDSLVANNDEITVPDTGVPTSNSIRGVSPPPDPRTDRGDVGFLDTYGQFGYVSNPLPSRCDDNSTFTLSDYSFGTSVQVRKQGDGTVASDYDEIAELGGANRYQMESYLRNVPNPLVEPCDQVGGVPYQTGVEFSIFQTGDTTANDVSFDISRPDGDSSDGSAGDGILNLILSIVNSVTGVWGGVATAVLNYGLTTSSDDDRLITRDNSYEGNKQFYAWDLTLEGYNDVGESAYFVDQPDNAAGVSPQLENLSASGNAQTLKNRSRFEFGHLWYIDGKCPCEISSTVFTTSQTGTVENVLEYQSVPG